MSSASPLAPRDRRFTVWISVITATLLAAAAVGFVGLPLAQSGRNVPDIWDVICSAIGLPSADVQPLKVQPGKPASEVAWTVDTRRLLASGSAARGATIAGASCANCHGSRGVSDDAIFPNLAAQSAASIYKQLQDFRTGMRDATVMGVYVASLREGDIRDLAVYYASLPAPAARRDGVAVVAVVANAATQRLADYGDPMRGIPACAACHGPAGITTGAPLLHGQQRAYLELQLQALASGARHNDINAQMRVVARQLTAQEINALATYYAESSARTPAVAQPSGR